MPFEIEFITTFYSYWRAISLIVNWLIEMKENTVLICWWWFRFLSLKKPLKFHVRDIRSEHRAQRTHTVVTEAAVGGTWRSEDFAGKAIFQLHCLTVDDDLLGPGRGPVARAAIGHVCGKTMECNQCSNKKMLRRKTPQTKWKKLRPSSKKQFFKL